MENDPLEYPVNDALVKALHLDGLLNPEAFFRARKWLRPERQWTTWAGRMLLIVGSTLLLAGIVFFFAFNWAAMNSFLKLGLIQSLILGLAAGAWKVGLDSLAGRALWISSAILVGVFLAVFGQIYPTGAQPYQLFLGWAAIILGWVVISNSGGMRFLWWALVNLAVILYWDRIDWLWLWIDRPLFLLTLAGLNGLALTIEEVLGAPSRGLRSIFLTAVFGALMFPIQQIIFWARLRSVEHVIACAIVGAIWITTYWYYRRRRPDFVAVSLNVLFLCVVVTSAVIRLVIEVLDALHALNQVAAFGMLFMGFCTIVIFALGALWLRFVFRTMQAEIPKAEPVPAPAAVLETAGADSKPSSIVSQPELTARQLLARLDTEGLLNPKQSAALRTALEKARGQVPLPWIVQGLVAVGAWIGGICFTGFLLLILEWSIFSSSNNKGGLLFFGSIWIMAATFSSRTTRMLFFTQLSLALSFAGHILVLFYVAESSGNNHPVIALTTVCVILAIVLNPLYDSATHRFLSAFGSLMFILALAADTHEPRLWLCVVLAQTVSLGFLFLIKKTPACLRPVGFALALALPVTILFMHEMSNRIEPEYVWTLNACVAFGLLFLTIPFLKRANASPGIFAMAVGGILLLALLGNTGILAAIGLLILGYAKDERHLTALGVLSLAVFLFEYYYNLNSSLADKSAILAASGIVLLLARAWLARRPQIAQEAAA